MVPMRVEGVRRNFSLTSVFLYTATLLDEVGWRSFDFPVERHEALAIVAALNGLVVPRPQTIHVMFEMLRFQGARAVEIHFEHMSGSPTLLVSATLVWLDGQDKSRKEEKQVIPPGDAIGLALLMDCPLLLSDELALQQGVTLADGQTPELYRIGVLLRREGITLPEGKRLRLGYSKTPMRDALVKEFKASLVGKAPLFPEEGLEQRKKDLLAFLLT